MITNVVSGKPVPGAFPPLLEPPPTGSEKLDSPATPAPAAASFWALPLLPLALTLPPVPPLLPEPVDGETVAEPELPEPPPIPGCAVVVPRRVDIGDVLLDRSLPE